MEWRLRPSFVDTGRFTPFSLGGRFKAKAGRDEVKLFVLIKRLEQNPVDALETCKGVVLCVRRALTFSLNLRKMLDKYRCLPYCSRVSHIVPCRINLRFTRIGLTVCAIHTCWPSSIHSKTKQIFTINFSGYETTSQGPLSLPQNRSKSIVHFPQARIVEIIVILVKESAVDLGSYASFNLSLINGRYWSLWIAYSLECWKKQLNVSENDLFVTSVLRNDTSPRSFRSIRHDKIIWLLVLSRTVEILAPL